MRFMRLHLLEDVKQRRELGRGLCDSLQRDLAAAIMNVAVEFQGMRLLFLSLLAKPFGCTRHVIGLRIGRHRQVKIGRVQLMLDLIVDGRFKILA